MSRRIIIGDVHGCFYTLQALLDKIAFRQEDHLFFLGDLIGKGPHSDQVLDYCIDLTHCKLVLGNHDLTWMNAFCLPGYDGVHQGSSSRRPDLQDLLQHQRAQVWFDFLQCQPFVIQETFGVLVHAAIDPSWGLKDLSDINNSLMRALQDNPKDFFTNIEPPQENKWCHDGSDAQKRYMAIQILTRARYYNTRGAIDLHAVGPPNEHKDLIPWYQLKRKVDQDIWFGHWAALKGCKLEHAHHLDGGAVYGGVLIAQDADTGERWEQRRVKEDEG